MSIALDAYPYASLAQTERSEVPFRYFLADRCFTVSVEEELLCWLEGDAPWNLVETDFYEQFEFDMRDAPLPAHLKSLVEPQALDQLRKQLGSWLGANLSSRIQVVAHRLDPGQRIGIHNDMRENGETHRLTVQLNRGLDDKDGGFFMLFNSDNAEDVHRILRPRSGTAVGFAISEASHHAVSQLYSGERFTLVYSFYAERA